MRARDALIDLLRAWQFRGKARLFNQLVPRTGFRNASVHGYRMTLDLSEHIQRMIYLGAYERWESQAVRQILKPGMRFVDVGANVGYFTLMASRLVGPHGLVIAIEPSAYAADRLATTIADNEVVNVRVERIGLGNQSADVVLYHPSPDNHSPSMLSDHGNPGSLVTVRRMDDCLREWGVNVIDLLKVDVEGYEPAVFDGGEEFLRSGKVRFVLCEFNRYWLARAGTSPTALHDRLLGLGFTDVTGSPWTPTSTMLNRLFAHQASVPRTLL